VKFTTPVNTGISSAPTRRRHVPRLRAIPVDDDVGYEPRRVALQRPGHPVGLVLQRRRRAARVPALLLRIPQSLGCVEMPFASAETVFPYTPIGTLVTVQSVAKNFTIRHHRLLL